jgi:hypothetical protein
LALRSVNWSRSPTSGSPSRPADGACRCCRRRRPFDTHSQLAKLGRPSSASHRSRARSAPTGRPALKRRLDPSIWIVHLCERAEATPPGVDFTQTPSIILHEMERNHFFCGRSESAPAAATTTTTSWSVSACGEFIGGQLARKEEATAALRNHTGPAIALRFSPSVCVFWTHDDDGAVAHSFHL